MQHIIVSLSLVLILVLTDLIPQFKGKEKRALWFAVPVYAVAVVIDILVGLGVKVVSPNQIVVTFIQTVLKIKL